MSFSVYEYSTVDKWGNPVEPATVRTASQALGAGLQLAASTVYVGIIPDADMYFRIAAANTAPTAADFKLSSGTPYGFAISENSRPYVRGLAVT